MKKILRFFAAITMAGLFATSASAGVVYRTVGDMPSPPTFEGALAVYNSPLGGQAFGGLIRLNEGFEATHLFFDGGLSGAPNDSAHARLRLYNALTSTMITDTVITIDRNAGTQRWMAPIDPISLTPGYIFVTVSGVDKEYYISTNGGTALAGNSYWLSRAANPGFNNFLPSHASAGWSLGVARVETLVPDPRATPEPATIVSALLAIIPIVLMARRQKR
ncbi:MAG: hypothetical protein KBD00_03900 [Candidatus Peribacteraceae bacterium]|nr:hypothetical protein [Candidatus Peribacteraceae bacterium]